MIALREKLAPLLVKALGDHEPRVRAAAAMTAGKLGVSGAAELLRERLAHDAAESVREAAMLGLLLLSDTALQPYFRDVLGNEEENPRVRAFAALALGRLGDEESFEDDALAHVASEDLQAVMTRAIGLFGKKPQAATLASWIRASKLPDVMRGHAGTGLRHIGTPDQVAVLLKQLRSVRVKPKHHVAQCAAALAIPAAVRRDDAKSLKAIRIHLENSEGRFAGTRTRLALSLGKIGGPDAERILINAYEGFRNKSTRYAERGHFLLSIGLVGSDTAREFLRAEFEKLPHEFDAAACALALALAQDKRAIAPIRSRLYESSAEFTPHGMMALALLGDRLAVAAIRDAIERRGGSLIRSDGGRALALLLRGKALPDLISLWERCGNATELDACADALALTNDASVAAPLMAILHDTAQRTPLERAFALVALGRVADPAREPRLAQFARDFHPYAGGSTLTLLARYRDVPFLY